MHEQLGFSYESLNDSYAAGSAGLSVGALIFIPFALKFGRRPVYVLSTLVQFFMSIWFAKVETVADIVLVNVFACLVGALAEVLVQMTVADLFFVHERGLMNTIYIWVQLVGADVAPLVAGYITGSQGWRWVWWWVAIFFGVTFLLLVFLYEETTFIGHTIGVDPIHSSRAVGHCIAKQGTVENKKQNDMLDAENGNYFVAGTAPDIDPSIPRKTYFERLSLWSSSPSSLKFFAHHIYQPLVVTVAFPGCAYTALLYGLVFATWQVMITVVASNMAEPPYNFNASAIGLMTLAPFIGITVGSMIAGPLSDRLVLWQVKRNRGLFEPEMRLWILLPFAPPTVAGIMLFGYSLGNGKPWIIVALGYAIFGFGMGPVCSIALSYLVDTYRDVSGCVQSCYGADPILL